MTFTWVNGRNLETITKNGNTFYYSYDEDGNRTSKSVGDAYTQYMIFDGIMYGERTYDSNSETVIYYLYDENDNKYGFTYNGTYYYYQFNLQGDVTGIYDANGQLVVQYAYDAWGKLLSVTGSKASTIGQANPIRYRGYYYDNETGFYYLQSRYYDSETGRFINADGEIPGTADSINGYNLFSYAFNNPINMDDQSGNWPKWATKLILGTAVIAAAAVLTVATAGSGTALACFAVGALKGAVVGAAIGAASGAATGAISHRIKTGSWKGAGKAALEGAADGYMSGAVSGFISGGLTSNVCFVAGTSILTSIGYVAIENIQIGDMVWAENPETGKKALKKVVQTFENETNELVHVFVNGEEIITTPEHPFYVSNKGWISSIELRAGDILVRQNGEYCIVEKIQHEILESPIKVYNFEVSDFHTYFVGASSILVHNLCTQNPSSRAAMREAKRSVNIPMSQKPDIIQKVKMVGENGRTVFAKMEIYGNKYIRNDLGGHLFSDGMKMGRHFNAGIIDDIGREISNNIHFFY